VCISEEYYFAMLSGPAALLHMAHPGYSECGTCDKRSWCNNEAKTSTLQTGRRGSHLMGIRKCLPLLYLVLQTMHRKGTRYYHNGVKRALPGKEHPERLVIPNHH